MAATSLGTRLRRPSRRVVIWTSVVTIVFLVLFPLAPNSWGDLGGTLLGFIPNMLEEAYGNMKGALSTGVDAFQANLPSR